MARGILHRFRGHFIQITRLSAPQRALNAFGAARPEFAGVYSHFLGQLEKSPKLPPADRQYDKPGSPDTVNPIPPPYLKQSRSHGLNRLFDTFGNQYNVWDLFEQQLDEAIITPPQRTTVILLGGDFYIFTPEGCIVPAPQHQLRDVILRSRGDYLNEEIFCV